MKSPILIGLICADILVATTIGLLAVLDWTQIMIAFIVGLPGIIAACGTVYVNARLKIVAANVQKVETATNSMKDALVLATRKGALLEGHAAGIKEAEDKRRPT